MSGQSLAAQIHGLDFDHPFKIVGGNVEDVPDEFAPEVYHSETNDVEIFGDDWETVSNGMTGQYSYNGPVMHSSEFVGDRIAERLAELAEDYSAFALVVVEVLPEDDDPEPEPAGWAIIGKRV